MERQVRIGVDDLFFAKGRWWCHMLCDDFSPQGLYELHQFAQQIGLSPRAFHNPSGNLRPHYDLLPEYRDRAVAQGAEQLDRRTLVAFLNAGRERATDSV